jgi:hypothetical protein
MTFHVPEQFRVKKGELGSTQEYGNNGAFLIRSVKLPRVVTTIASDGMGFEHVSVSVFDRCPNWLEMCFIKDCTYPSRIGLIATHLPYICGSLLVWKYPGH